MSYTIGGRAVILIIFKKWFCNNVEVEDVVEFEVIRTFEKPLERQVAEAVFIHNCKADKLLNSKSEWEQPAIERLIVTRELPEAGEPGAGRGRGRGRRQGGANQ